MQLQSNLTDIDPLAVRHVCLVCVLSVNSQGLTVVVLQQVCNDGTSATYYFRKGASTTNLWVLYLEGGMWCYSAQTCQLRWRTTPWEMSNAKLANYVALGGIFSVGRKNPWAEANVAYLPYCSSDAHVGDSFAFGWHFRGQRIINAVLTSLVREQGMGVRKSKDETRVPTQRLLLGGCSAGARGAMMNLDYIQPTLASMGITQQQVTVSGLLDSPLWIDVDPLQPHVVSLANETQAVFSFVNATARMGPGCATLYPGAEGWKCLFGQYRMPLLQTPYILNAAQDDKFELPWNIGGTTNAGYDVQAWHPAQLAYATAFGPLVKRVIDTLPVLPAQKGSAVFSTACFRHCVSDSALFWNVAVAPASIEDPSSAALHAAAKSSGKRVSASTQAALMPISLRDAAEMWYFGKPGRTMRYVQNCTGFRCGQCTTKSAKKIAKASGRKFDQLLQSGGPGQRSRRVVATTVMISVGLALCLVCMLIYRASSALGRKSEKRAGGIDMTPQVRRPMVTGFRDKAGGMARPGDRYGSFGGGGGAGRGKVAPLSDEEVMRLTANPR